MVLHGKVDDEFYADGTQERLGVARQESQNARKVSLGDSIGQEAGLRCDPDDLDNHRVDFVLLQHRGVVASAIPWACCQDRQGVHQAFEDFQSHLLVVLDLWQVVQSED